MSGPVSLPAPDGARLERVVSAQEMFAACEARFEACDVLIMVAAVADYRAAAVSGQKTKKKRDSWVLELVPTTDILKTLGARKTHQLLVGFAAETRDVERYARGKLEEKNLDWIVANDVSVPGLGMEADRNQVTLFSREGIRLDFGPAPKPEVAEFILRTVAAR